jgi:hypothetical protein
VSKTLFTILVVVLIAGASAPAITGLLGSIIPLVLVCGAVTVVLRIVWYLTDRY